MKRVAAIVVLWVFAMAPLSHAADPMQAFPPAEAGMLRHVLQLPKQADESALKVELIVGRTVLLDAHNRYFFGGRIQKEDIKGWGYPRYVVGALGPMAGTQMAVDPNAPKVDRFITLAGEPYLIRYNSRLPVVVYAPEGVEVRYRVWKAEPQAKAIDKG
jgi:ecotin